MLLKVLKWGKHTSSKFLANLVVPVTIFCEQLELELRIEYCLPVYIRIRRLFTSLRSFSGIETASQVHFWLIGSMEPSLKPPGMHPPTLKPSNKTWSCQTTPGLYSYIFKIILKPDLANLHPLCVAVQFLIPVILLNSKIAFTSI